MDRPYRILLADDYVSFRRELRKLIEKTAGWQITAELGDGPALYQSLENATPDLVVLDICMPNLKAMCATQSIKRKYPEIKVLVMVMDHDEEYLYQAIRVGADGVLLKQYAAAEFIQAINTIPKEEYYLPGQFLENCNFNATVGQR